MSRLVGRILLSILMVPLAGLLYVVVVVAVDRWLNAEESVEWLVADLATWVGVMVYWWLLWRSAVRWTRRRTIGTLATAVAAASVGAGGGLLAALVGHDSVFGPFVAGVLTITLWLGATVFLWRETPAERAARVGAGGASTVTCPTCGYNLTGLADARCPECGSRFTLDELLAAQPARVASAELE